MHFYLGIFIAQYQMSWSENQRDKAALEELNTACKLNLLPLPLRGGVYLNVLLHGRVN
jgi:hypothetical protein